MNPARLLPLFGLVAALLFGCRRDELFTDDPGVRLSFTEDTIFFDTVFTTIGSVTKRFVVHNPNDNAVRVQVTLAGGDASPYRINVDGGTGAHIPNVEILGRDSAFVFVEVTVDPNSGTSPMVVEDHIVFNTNGTDQQVLLVAWGRDVHVHRNIPGLSYGIIAGGQDPNGNPICETVEWHNDKPYLIYGRAVVDSCSKLIIHPGVKVYFHGGSGMWIYRHGSIEANGTAEERITFQGDRLEPMYQDLPGQWDRIWVMEGTQDNVFNYCVIRNALVGIQCETAPWLPLGPTSANKLVLDNTIIYNSSAAGLLSRNYRIRSTNLLVADAGQYAVALLGGGEYTFNHSTIANYWGSDIREEPAFYLSNKVATAAGTQVRDILASTFTNGIIYGNNANEFQLDLDNAGARDFTFRHWLFRTDQPTNNTQYFPEQWNIFRNQSPGFVSTGDKNFHLNQNGFARNRATTTSDPVSFQDLDGLDRFWGDEPDLGSSEWRP